MKQSVVCITRFDKKKLHSAESFYNVQFFELAFMIKTICDMKWKFIDISFSIFQNQSKIYFT